MRPFRTPAVHRPERLEHLFSPYDEPIHHWTSTPVQPRTGTLSTSRVSVPRVRTRGTLPWPGEQTVPAPRVTLTVRVWLASHPAKPREGGWQDRALQSLYATAAASRWSGRPVGLKICLPLAGAGEIRRNADLVVWCSRRRCRKVRALQVVRRARIHDCSAIRDAPPT